MSPALMHLKVLLPFQVFVEKMDVLRIVAETPEGSFGLLPHRLDCVAPLVAGILTFETSTDGVAYFAVDEGVLVKAGADVLVSVRRAVAGRDLAKLHETVEKEFQTLDQVESDVRSVSAKMESGFIRRFLEFHHG